MYTAETITCKENYGSDPVSRLYVKNTNGRVSLIETKEKFDNAWQIIREVFLPQGYPDSVSEDYLEYQMWDTIQAFASSITGTLAAEAMLKGYGVGNENAAVLGATLTWMLKDGTGMLGRILFTWVQGTSLDCDAKRWRFFADILNDIAIFLEIISPILGGYFILIVCTAGLCKSIVGVAGGATRAALTQHQARRDNMADVSAKDGSQETLVNLAALICGLIIMPIVSGKTGLIWVLFFFFTSIHLFANYRAVNCVVMETVNQARLHILAGNWLSQGDPDGMNVKTVNYKEPVLLVTRRKFRIKLGVSIQDIAEHRKELDSLKGIFYTEKYILDLIPSKGEIHIILQRDCDSEDQIKACFHAELINYIAGLSGNTVSDEKLEEMVESFQKEDNSYEFLQQTTAFVSIHFPKFVLRLKQQGWLTSKAQLGPDEWRTDWSE